jgi:hypothetical protein
MTEDFEHVKHRRLREYHEWMYMRDKIARDFIIEIIDEPKRTRPKRTTMSERAKLFIEYGEK